MRVLFIGGTGEISGACVNEAARRGHRVTVFNRGRRSTTVPNDVEHIAGDVADQRSYEHLGAMEFDVVCQFLGFDRPFVERDIDLFSGRCGQYVFVSSASAYQKPCQSHLVTEETPLDNPFMDYSRNKAACEAALTEADGKLPATIVRPSHTYRERLPSTLIDGVHLLWRIRNDKPVVVHGDGESLWTLTRAEDFARAFCRLFGNAAALGEAFHITDSGAHTWNVIVKTIGDIARQQPEICHVASERLARYNEDWRGPLLGDKSNSMVFDNSKIRGAIGNWRCETPLREGLARAFACAEKRLTTEYLPNPALDSLIDRIVEEQAARHA